MQLHHNKLIQYIFFNKNFFFYHCRPFWEYLFTKLPFKSRIKAFNNSPFTMVYFLFPFHLHILSFLRIHNMCVFWRTTEALDLTGTPAISLCCLQYSKFLLVSYAPSVSTLPNTLTMEFSSCVNSLQSPTLSFVMAIESPSPVSSFTTVWNFAHA